MAKETRIQRVDCKNSDANVANENIPITFMIGKKTFTFDIKRIATKDLRQLAERATEVLASRRSLPPNLYYQPQVPASLLTLPRELRDKIYQYCDITVPRPGTANEYARFTLSASEAEGNGHVTDCLRPTKRQRLSSFFAASSSSPPPPPPPKTKPFISLYFRGPQKFASLRLVCRQFHDELVREVFRSHALHFKINMTYLPDAYDMSDTWDKIFPRWLWSILQRANIEIRCRMEQWKQMREIMCDRLRRVIPTPKLNIRFTMPYPLADEKSFLSSLPMYCQVPGMEKGFREAWVLAHIKLHEESFELLKNVGAVELFQVIHMGRRSGSTLPDSQNIMSYATEHAMVQKRNDKDWQKVDGQSVLAGNLGKHFDVNQDCEIEDL